MRAGLITRSGDSIEVVEVKSSTKVKDINVVDCAIKYWVMDQVGFNCLIKLV
jgi:hypothetical protein